MLRRRHLLPLRRRRLELLPHKVTAGVAVDPAAAELVVDAPAADLVVVVVVAVAAVARRHRRED